MSRELLVVVGARPNFVKVAPVVHALADVESVTMRVLDTGQHYDHHLSEAFLKELRFPEVDHALDVRSGTHAEQTAAVMVGVERVLAGDDFDAVLVAGDVNSTLAASLAAVKLGVPVIHLEAGLRSGDRNMPEEINRLVTDRVSDLLLCHSADAVDNLIGEGVASERVELVGNTMIDSLFAMRAATDAAEVLAQLDLRDQEFVLVTLHRPEVVDRPENLTGVLGALRAIAGRIPVVLPLHPRTRARLGATALDELEGLIAIEPAGYREFVALEGSARLVITDSGGVQEETSALGVPCLTYRTTTERPITISLGTNRLVGVDPQHLEDACDEVLGSPLPEGAPEIPLWDGRAGGRAARAIEQHLQRRRLLDVGHHARRGAARPLDS